MSLTWVICGAGRNVGKTTLAQKLCDVLPDAVYAKQGCGRRKPGKPENLFRNCDEVAAFVNAASVDREHIVVESNEMVLRGQGDLVIFLDGMPGGTDSRSDSDLLREKAHVRIDAHPEPDHWNELLKQKLSSPALCDRVHMLLAQHAERAREIRSVVRPVTPLRLSTTGGSPVPDPSHVAVEALVTILIDGVGSFTLMCTPCDVKALAFGFAFSEGLISSADDVLDFSYRPDQQVVGLKLDDPGRGASGRNLIVTSSCGLCGSRNIDKLLSGRMTSRDSLRVPSALLRTVAEAMQDRQALFTRTGGTHAGAVFTADGELIAFGEDIGRHNALDKAIGRCLLSELSLEHRGVVLSGRVSLELVAKAANAGIQIIVGVSAPSSLALDVAERCNVTLCAFVREERATVYTHPHRIIGAQT